MNKLGLISNLGQCIKKILAFCCFWLLLVLMVKSRAILIFKVNSSYWQKFIIQIVDYIKIFQSYEIKSPPWTILWFRILGIFSVENIKRLCVFMFQTCDNSQLLRRVLWISAELTIVSSLKHKNTQPLYIFNRLRVLHLDRLKEGTWLHSFEIFILCTYIYIFIEKSA